MGEEFIRRIMVLGLVPSLGPVILYDDMESLLKWTKSGTGGDDLLEASGTVAYNGAKSLHAKTRATNPAADDKITAQRRVFARPGKRYRLECLFQGKTWAYIKFLSFRVLIYDGATEHHINMRWTNDGDKWQYQSAVAAWTDIPDGSQVFLSASWHRMAVEFDQAALKITRFVCDSMELDLTDVVYYSGALGGAQYADVQVEVQAVGTDPPEVFVDDLLLLEI